MAVDGIPVLRPQGAKVGAVHHDISSDGEEDRLEGGEDSPPAEPYPAGLLYVQRIEELEQLGEILRTRLSDLHERERALRMEQKDKNDLIAHLMKKSNISDLNAEDAASGKLGDPFWRRGLQQADSVEAVESVIQETTQENIRLRNDMKIMAEELRKALAVLDGPSLAK